MILASASLCRLRAAARLALARRAVARRTDRAAGAAGLCSETWSRTSTGAMVSSSVRHLRHQRRMLSVAFSIEAVLSLAWAAHGVRGTRSPERSLGNTGTTETVQQRPNGTTSPAVTNRWPRPPASWHGSRRRWHSGRGWGFWPQGQHHNRQYSYFGPVNAHPKDFVANGANAAQCRLSDVLGFGRSWLNRPCVAGFGASRPRLALTPPASFAAQVIRNVALALAEAPDGVTALTTTE
jgi:hypothetical protein